MDKLSAEALLDVLAKSLDEWNKINKKNGVNKNESFNSNHVQFNDIRSTIRQ